MYSGRARPVCILSLKEEEINRQRDNFFFGNCSGLRPLHCSFLGAGQKIMSLHACVILGPENKGP